MRQFWEQAVVAYFKVLYRIYFEGLKKTGNPQTVTCPRKKIRFLPHFLPLVYIFPTTI
jgi:hypothetical protein